MTGTRRAGPVNVYVSTLAPSDAVSDQARHHVALLRDWGYDAELVAEGWHPDLAREVMGIDRALGARPDAAWVVHFSIWGHGIPRILGTGGRPKVLVFHNVTPPDLLPAGPVAERCRRALDELPGLRSAWDLVIADSEFNAADLRRAGFDGVEVVPLLLPGPPAPPSSGEREDSVLFVGRIAPSKGVDDLIKAFGLLRLLHRPRAVLHIVGSPAGWERYAAGLEVLVDRIGCGGVVFHRGVTDAERDEYYARAGVVCLMSRHEGFGAPIVEAMRAGAPVVARDVGATREILRGGGLLLPDGDPRLAAEALATVLADAPLRERLRRGAREALAGVDPDAVTARLRATLGTALAPPARH